MLAALLLAGCVQSAAARVLVLVNRNSPSSLEIAADYCKLRKLEQRLEVACQDSALDVSKETISYRLFHETIEKPLLEALAARPEIDFIVLTKGIPIRIKDAPGLGMDERQPSLDSWIACSGYAELAGARKLALHDKPFHGTAYANRFWNSTQRFSHREQGGYLVTRLDGYSVADAKALVARALAAEAARPKAQILLDACAGFGFGDRAAQPWCVPEDARIVEELLYKDYNADMAAAAERLGQLARFDPTSEFLGGSTPLAGYVSWGSNDPQFAPERYHELRFVPGALVETAVSTSGRTFLATQGGQSLIADLVHQGATGAKGYVDEPLLQAMSSPSILFERYLRGWTLAESYYAASRFVGWEDVVLGDPLCCPYRD